MSGSDLREYTEAQQALRDHPTYMAELAAQRLQTIERTIANAFRNLLNPHVVSLQKLLGEQFPDGVVSVLSNGEKCRISYRSDDQSIDKSKFEKTAVDFVRANIFGDSESDFQSAFRCTVISEPCTGDWCKFVLVVMSPKEL